MAGHDHASDITISEAEARALALDFLIADGLGRAQAEAMAETLVKAQRDGCKSHGLQRLPGTRDTMAHPRFNRAADPQPEMVTPAMIRIDAGYGFSVLAAKRGLPLLIAQAQSLGIAVLAVQNGFHSTALWPVVEEIAEAGLAAMSMNPTHDWVAPAGGSKGILGTNPLAFAWPRADQPPYVFDFATTAAARADIALYRNEGRTLPEGWGLDRDGSPSTDPAAVLAGAMLPFGGHKGSALATMIELMAGPFIGDRTSAQSAAFDQGASAAPLHGELIIAFNPAVFGNTSGTDAAETVLNGIRDQGARLPGERRHAARAQSAQCGIALPRALHARILSLMPQTPSRLP
ncbi:Ldh family oxidoreductase [Paracoccus cavernae]|uniref:Ldh family oxidoreductase n=1 Tax=Paracoccus cavernae TaxID=1571207 RepID=UPI0035F3E4D4